MAITSRSADPGALARRARAGALLTPLVFAAGPSYVASRYGRVWYFYDEWGIIDRVDRCGVGAGCLLEPHNGHAMGVTRLVYWAQMRLLGLDGHALVYGAFLVSLVLFHVALARLLSNLGIPRAAAVTSAGLVTYLGLGSQSMLFEIQLGPNLGFALTLGAIGAVLRGPAPSRARMASVAAALALAVACDSSLALLGLVFAAVATVGLWPLRSAMTTLAPAALLHLAWLAFGRASDPLPRADAFETARYAGHLLLRGGGSLLASYEYVGLLLFVTAAASVASLHRAGELPRPVLAVWAGGMLAALASAGTIAFSRAAVAAGSWVDFNRYVQTVAIFSLPACLPPLGLAMARLTAAGTGREQAARIWRVATLVVIGSVIAGIPALRDYQARFDGYVADSSGAIHEAQRVLDSGCPDGSTPSPEAIPAPGSAPQVSVDLLRRLVADGVLTSSPPVALRPDVVERLCPGG